MRFARSDMRGYIVSHKNDYGASHCLHGVLQWRSFLKNHLLRDFRRRSIFDFCNNICQKRPLLDSFRERCMGLKLALQPTDRYVDSADRPLGPFWWLAFHAAMGRALDATLGWRTASPKIRREK